MTLYFRIKSKLNNNEIQAIDYPLSEVETEKLFQQVGRDFLSIPASNNDIIILELDVTLEDTEMIQRMVTILSDMFPSSLKSFQNIPCNKRKKKDILIQLFIEHTTCPLIEYENTISFELDKFFMMYYIIVAQRDTSNINRNITNKLNRIGINTINFVPFVGRVELSDEQFNKVKRKAINIDNSEQEQNLLVLDRNSFEVQKMTENDTLSYIYLYKREGVSVKNCTHEYYLISITKQAMQNGSNLLIGFSDEQENIKLSDIYTRCKLFNDLCNSTKKLPYKEIIGIVTNLYNTNIRTSDSNVSSINYILDHLDEHQKKLWKLISIFIKCTNCLPQKCREFCSYANSCTHAKTMLRTVHIKKDTIEKIDRDEKYVTVEEAKTELQQVMTSAYNSLENNNTDLEVVIAPPGAGKTHKIIDFIIEGIKNGKSFIYAIPNRITIDNFVERLEKRKFTQYIITPSLEEIKDKDRQKQIKLFQTMGAFTKLSKYIGNEIKILKEKESLSKMEKTDLEIMNHYLEVNGMLKEYEGLIITTHHRVSFFEKEVYQNKICFIDEDIFDTEFVRDITIPLTKIRNTYANSKILEFSAIYKLKQIEDMPYDIIKKVSSINIDMNMHRDIENQLIISQSNAINIFDFLRCKAVKKYKCIRDGISYTNIKCFMFNELPSCPVMITTATPKDEFYKLQFFNRKLQIHKISKAKYKGQIILWDSHTYSNTFMSNEENLVYVEELLEMCQKQDMNLITFKDFIIKYKMLMKEDTLNNEDTNKFLLKDIDCYWFFSILGLDELKDKDLAVIGKPLKDDDIFYFLALLLYDKEYEEEQRCQMQLVEDKGFLFNLYTYNDEILRKIQMWSISSNEEQYVGRARIYDNEDRRVYLASGYPVEQMIVENEETEGIGKLFGL